MAGPRARPPAPLPALAAAAAALAAALAAEGGLPGPRDLEDCDAGACKAEESDTLSALQKYEHARRNAVHHSSNSVEVFVMMPLTTVTLSGKLQDPASLTKQLRKIKRTGAAGIMTDVWWGITQRNFGEYDFDAYGQLFDICKQIGLKVQVVTSFHQCCYKGEDCYIPLPAWILDKQDIWFKNALGDETRAYISLFADNEKVIRGKTPMELYESWLRAFADNFRHLFGSLIVEVMLGMGTDGELKYPSYENPFTKWVFPGIGMFQASDKYALESLKQAATRIGKNAWALPPNATETGDYNSAPLKTEYFREGGTYQTAQGKFFLRWYSGALIDHGKRMLRMASKVLAGRVRISGKIAGVHWWFKTASHAAELNAGYYNANNVDAYGRIAAAFRDSDNATVDFTALEMTDASQPPDCLCGPQELVFQVESAAQKAGVPFTGENALSFYNTAGYEQITTHKPPMGALLSVTYLRLSDELLQRANLENLAEFVSQMKSPGFTTPYSMSAP